MIAGLMLLLALFIGCTSQPSTPPAGAPPLPEGYKYVDGVLKALQVNGGTFLIISTAGGEIRQFKITRSTRFEIDGTPCSMDILRGRHGWELSVYYWKGKGEADTVIIRSHPGWKWEATLIVTASIIPGPPEAPEKRLLKVKVTDSRHGQPVAEAAITLHPVGTTPPPGAPQPFALILGSTNQAGELTRDLDTRWQGKYIVRAKKGGYNPGETEIDFSLLPSTSRLERLPAIKMPEGKPVVVSQKEIESSPGIEMVDILISIDGEALFILLAKGTTPDHKAFCLALARHIGLKVDTVSIEPFLWVKVQGMPTRDQLMAALDKVGVELRWYTGRAVGWGNYW